MNETDPNLSYNNFIQLMTSLEYRQTILKTAIVNYWNRKTVFKSTGLYEFLKQIDVKLSLQPGDKRYLHSTYANHVLFLTKLATLNIHVRNKAKAEFDNFKVNSTSPEVIDFWNKVQEKDQRIQAYKTNIDQDTLNEKSYLSSLHIKRLQDGCENDVLESSDSAEESYDTNGVEKMIPAESHDVAEDLTTDESAELFASDAEIHDLNEDLYIEKVESQETFGHIKQWILSSGTDVAVVLREYAQNIPDTQKNLNPVYWGILDLTGDHIETKALFTLQDWEEMVENFEQEVKLSKIAMPEILCCLFDEIHKIVNSSQNIRHEIDRLSPESIAEKCAISLNNKDYDLILAVKHTILTYIENLTGVDLPISESDFDNSFPNMLMKRFLDKAELKIDVGEICCWASAKRRNEGRSTMLRARIGQKCDFKGTLKNNIDSLEAIVGLRSGGLPEAHRKKIFEDHIDLAVTMRDILSEFFHANPNSPDDKLHQTFILGIQSWGWVYNVFAMDCKATNVCRFSRLRRTKLPNTMRMIACLEEFYATISDVKATLKVICDRANNVALANAQVYRIEKNKRNEGDDNDDNATVGGCFGDVMGTPNKKKRDDGSNNQNLTSYRYLLYD
ncbi:5896_t:CDS:2 [Funneliformis geosporum]|nr:5896_t:CDS:2 [Funneliformis geosporum]